MNVGKRDCEESSPEFGGKIKRTRSVYRFVVGTQHLPMHSWTGRIATEQGGQDHVGIEDHPEA